MILFIEPVAIQLSAQQAELIESGNSFAFDIFRNVAEAEQEGKNLMISPLSISVALSMTLTGPMEQPEKRACSILRSRRLGGLRADEIEWHVENR